MSLARHWGLWRHHRSVSGSDCRSRCTHSLGGGDGRAPWTAGGAQIRRRGLLAVLGYPVAIVILLLNLLKSIHLHWVQASVSLWLACASAPPVGHAARTIAGVAELSPPTVQGAPLV